jgi:uncharacterized protein
MAQVRGRGAPGAVVAVKALMGRAVETPLFVPIGSSQLFAVLHEPAGDFLGRAFVFCHPFGEEKLWSHRVFVSFARELARRGYAVLRFDCRGNGDSDGAFSASSLRTNLEDLGAAVAFLRSRVGVDRVALLGLRLGATTAALFAEGRDDVSMLVLWGPITDGARHMQELLRINLTTQLAVHGAVTTDREMLVEQLRLGRTVNVDGYDVALPLFEEVSAVTLTAAPRLFAGPCLILQLDRNPAAVPARDLVSLQQQFAHATLSIVTEEPFWKEIQRFYDRPEPLFQATLAWLESAS